MKPKLCYIVPEYRARDATHFSYLLDFVEKSAKHLDIFLIVERSDDNIPTTLPMYRQKFSWFPLRWLENALVINYLRFRGYKDFYIHYSFLSALNASIVVRFFGGRVFYWNCGLPWKFKRGFIREYFERRVYQMISFLITGTESLKREYSDQYKIPMERIKIMPNWIDIDRINKEKSFADIESLKKQLRIPSGIKVMLFIHRLSKRKGAHYIPEIVSRLRDENVFLLVAGDGPERQNIESAINNLQLSSKSFFLGDVPHIDIVQYFALSDIFIMPSEEEGFPHVLLEAMGVGVPFVAFDVGGVREISPVEMRCFVYDIGAIETFVNGIKEILHTSSSEYSALQQAEKTQAQKFDINNILPLFYDFFKE